VTTTTPVADPNSQATPPRPVSQYNNVLNQIATTAKDASFNGVNLLKRRHLKLVFNETGTSILSITGVSFSPGGLGLANLVAGTDFIDNAATNRVLASLTAAGTTLRSEASALGANLSVVQIRQDFSKNLINVLKTGSSNLTLADTNEGKRPTTRRCRPVSRSRSPRWRSPIRPSRTCSSSCSNLGSS